MDRGQEILLLKNQLAEIGGNPELINSGQNTAPSKRIVALIPEYDKVLAGNELAKLIGMSV